VDIEDGGLGIDIQHSDSKADGILGHSHSKEADHNKLRRHHRVHAGAGCGVHRGGHFRPQDDSSRTNLPAATNFRHRDVLLRCRRLAQFMAVGAASVLVLFTAAALASTQHCRIVAHNFRHHQGSATAPVSRRCRLFLCLQRNFYDRLINLLKQNCAEHTQRRTR
jgi:hypothetical protein